MLVLLHFHQRGLSALQLAFLFLLYEFFGIVTNLFGGWLASAKGLKITLTFGLSLQIFSLILLSLTNPNWSIPIAISWIIGTQALSGIAKDLTKMSSKSAVKVLAPKNPKDPNENKLFKWVALLTGSKNALKGFGFFLGGLLLTILGFQWALWSMAIALAFILIFTKFSLPNSLGQAKQKTKFNELFSQSPEINWLSAARLFLFASRDIWFVVALPIFLSSQFQWSHSATGAFMATWVIGYGIVQALAPKIQKNKTSPKSILHWGIALLAISSLISLGVQFQISLTLTILGGLIIFGFIFAMNSALHSYLILAFSDNDKTALNVGFYYMANAGGRLLGTLLSGLTYYLGGLPAALWTSTAAVFITVLITNKIPRKKL